MTNRNLYIWSGLGLLVSGSLLFLSAYFILGAVWLTSLGICMLILAFILLALGRTIPRLSPEVCGLLLETGIDNMATLVEELGIKSRAIYLPSSLASGRPQALIPLRSSPSHPVVSKAVPQRLIVRYGSSPDDIGLLLSTVGSTAAGMLELRPGPSATALEEALTSLFTGTLGVADGVKVRSNDGHIEVEVRNPRIDHQRSWSHQCLGGPLASIVASVAADAWDKPVIITQEEHNKRGKYLVKLELVR